MSNNSRTYWNEEYKKQIILPVQSMHIFTDENVIATAEILSVDDKKFKEVRETWKKSIKELDSQKPTVENEDDLVYQKYLFAKGKLLDEIITIIFDHFRISPHFHFSKHIIDCAKFYSPLQYTLLKTKLETTWQLLRRDACPATYIDLPNGKRLYNSKVSLIFFSCQI